MRPFGVEKSYEMFHRATELIPGGTQLISRRPDRYAFGVTPFYAQRAKGCRFWDVDGNEYIDLQMAVGANVLGYADDVVDDAVIAQVRRGPAPSVSNQVELELAEELVQTIPCCEMVRYCKGGGEANVIAIRIARAYTGREKIAFCGYHGWHDWYLAANLESTDTLNNYLLPGIEPAGVPRGLAGTAIPFEWENLESLRAVLEQNEGQVAAIIMEAARSDQPKPGYLEGVRELATKHGVVLIFDEVVTGFRLSLSGAQGLFGVTPDMATYAKAISNGYPFGAVTGKKEIMSKCGELFVSSTYWSDPITVTAALTTVREYKRRQVHDYIWKIGQQYQDAFNALAAKWEVPARFEGFACNFGLKWNLPDPTLVKPATTFWVQECNKRGIFPAPGAHMSWAHKAEDLEILKPRWEQVLELLRDALSKGDLRQRLESEVGKEAFRRLVR